MSLKKGSMGFLCVLTMTLAFSQAQAHGHKGHKFFKECAESLNIPLPAKGSGQELSTVQKNDLHACVKAKVEAARVVAQAETTNK